jgi:hypothetical protein
MTGSIQSVSRQSVVCCICAVPLPLETSKTDEHGTGVHEECYFRKTISQFRTDSAVQLSENWVRSIFVRFQRRFHATDTC